MLDADTKRRIDTARDILVGKLPDPKAQVEQITIALIYKFMDDMDKQSEELGGKAKFFTGEFEKYAWSKIFDPRVSGHELVGLYGEAIQRMNQNPNIPQLFRDIFKNAYLPYRDPETLKGFLKTIAEFEYDHSEKLGDAFEYLLSVMGSQGDAGQFRTPRHIIDFIVKVVNPSKDDTILDPACGTAGFLISAFKHILEKNVEDGHSNLTPDQRKRLTESIAGYDISPDMVRLSLVNLYLHGFNSPKIFEYDTLTSEDRWSEVFDVVLANPPFMTPKGGIRPHKRFSVQANRSEVLFVDYIHEHLNPNGRAGIVVPEGIIFQSGSAYKSLRKMLLEQSLYAVVSLPAGVFNPYSGVKTSILLMDKNIAKKTDKILFVKIGNDGYNLGAQRRAIKENDLPLALEIIKEYQSSVLADQEPELEKFEQTIAHLTEKEKIIENGYNLSGDRYKEVAVYDGNWDLVELGEVCDIFNGSRPKGGAVGEGVLSIGGEHINADGSFDLSNPKYVPKDYFASLKRGKIEVGDVLIVKDGATTGKTGYYGENAPFKEGAVNEHVFILRVKDRNFLNPYYLYQIIKSELGNQEILRFKVDGGIGGINLSIKEAKIPVPPLEVQDRIVNELENYSKIIRGAKQVVENYKPSFKIDLEWDIVELESVTEKITDGSHFSPQTVQEGYPYITVRDIVDDKIDFDNCKFVTPEDYNSLKKNGCQPQKNDLLFSKDGTVGKVAFVNFEKDFVVLSSLAIIRPNQDKIIPEFLKNVLQSEFFFDQAIENKTGVAIRRIVLKTLKTIKIPFPNLDVQKRIVEKLRLEQNLIDSNKELIGLFEKKVNEKVSEVWGE